MGYTPPPPGNVRWRRLDQISDRNTFPLVPFLLGFLVWWL